jgi:uncharacterized RDD family membrane protein YckC
MTTSQPAAQSTSQPIEPADGQLASAALPAPPVRPSIPMTWPPLHGHPPQPVERAQLGCIAQAVPPPQFGRLPHSLQLREPVRYPEPAALTQVPQADADEQASGDLSAVGMAEPLAGFGARVISCLIDYVAPVIVLNLVISLGVVFGSPTWPPVLGAVGYLGLLIFWIWNSGYLQGSTGQSLGRRLAHTKLVTVETSQPVGFGSAMARQICHGVEFGIGYLWPLWDVKRQTFADKISDTVVIRIDPPSGAGATTQDRTGSKTP